MIQKQVINKAFESSSAFYILEGQVDSIYQDVKSYFCEKYSIEDFEQNIDVRIYNGEDLDVSLVKKIIFEIGLKPFSNKKIIIISHFQNLKEIYQNMLLKCLEELPEDTLVIGICSQTVGILETIKSRAYNLYLSCDVNNENRNKALIDFTSKEIIQLFTKKIDEEEISTLLDDTLIKSEGYLKEEIKQSIRKNLKINNLANECYTRIASNCSKALSFDLLLFRILEEK